jgi:hypothetical protein
MTRPRITPSPPFARDYGANNPGVLVQILSSPPNASQLFGPGNIPIYSEGAGVWIHEFSDGFNTYRMSWGYVAMSQQFVDAPTTTTLISTIRIRPMPGFVLQGFAFGGVNFVLN